MNKQLPERADLEHLKGQAKALLSSLRAGEPEAIARAGLDAPSPRLSTAQRIVAREYGFSSWSKLKHHVEDSKDRRAAFFRALRGGDRDAVRKLLDADPALVHAHHEDSFGAPAITVAAERDDLPLIDLILERGADINARSDWAMGSFGALDAASAATSKYLISKGARLTAHAAARLGMVSELKEILSKNPDVVFERGGDGQFPLHFSKTPEIVDILVDAGSVLDARDLDHVSTAAQFRIQDTAVCRRLIERGATPDVYIAIMLSDVPLLEKLVDEDPEGLSRTPLQPGNPMILEAPGMPIYTYTIGLGRPFQIAQKFGKTDALRLLESRSSDAQKLMSACWRGDLAAASALSGEVARLSPKDMSILAEAAWERRLTSVKLMLELGFNPDAAGVHDSTPIDRAAFHGFADVIEAILPYKPSLTVKNEFGGTPLRACAYGSIHSWHKHGNFPKSIELLIEAGSPRPEKLQGSPAVNEVLTRYGIEIG